MSDNDSEEDDEEKEYENNWSKEEEQIAKAFKKLRCLFYKNEDEDDSF